MAMDSDALSTFVAVHRAGGFTAAAERLRRSQPAISRRIALLEAELGAPVFERVAGGVALSPAGQVLLPHAERVLAAVRDAVDAVGALKTGHGGPVAVAAVGTLAAGGLTRALKRFADAYPRAELTLRTATSAEVSELVRRGEATIGLRYHADPSADLVSHRLAPERMVVACAPDHPRAGTTVAGLRELAGERWLAFPKAEAGEEMSAWIVFAEFLTRGVAEIDWTPVDSLTAQKRLAEAGFGVVLITETAVVEELAFGMLKTITVEDLAVANPVCAVTRRDGYLSPAAEALLGRLAVET
jgi:DNA-binding transcriptional LysR family regulator